MLDIVLKFIGLLEYDARFLAIKENLLLRIVEPNTKLYGPPNLERINVVVENGIVIRAFIG